MYSSELEVFLFHFSFFLIHNNIFVTENMGKNVKENGIHMSVDSDGWINDDCMAVAMGRDMNMNSED